MFTFCESQLPYTYRPVSRVHRVWQGIPGIPDLNKIQRVNRETFDRIRNLTATRNAGSANILGMDSD